MFALVLVVAVVVGGDEELGGVTTSAGQGNNSSKIAAFGKCNKICPTLHLNHRAGLCCMNESPGDKKLSEPFAARVVTFDTTSFVSI